MFVYTQLYYRADLPPFFAGIGCFECKLVFFSATYNENMCEEKTSQNNTFEWKDCTMHMHAYVIWLRSWHEHEPE